MGPDPFHGRAFARRWTRAGTELPRLAQVLPALDRLALQLAAVTGAQTDRMTRDHGWRLLTVGRLLERLVGMTTRCRPSCRHQALHTRPASNCCWSCSTAPSPSAPATSATKTCWP
jgi:uncharacterized alpha-E superfamily protein